MPSFRLSAGAAFAALLLSMAPAISVPAMAAEPPIPLEHNPPGDIPDSQVFITYAGPGFSLSVPEGWSRNDITGGASFTDKYNIVAIAAAPGPQPSIDAVSSTIAADMVAAGRAVAIEGIAQVDLDGSPAIRIDYQSNSEPNAVTGKQIRLDRVRYLYFKAGTVVTLDMAAPAGADNVDQWLLMANSVALN